MYCLFKNYRLDNNGRYSLNLPCKGKKHLENLSLKLNAAQMTLDSYSDSSKPDNHKSETVKASSSVDTYVTKTDTLKAEIWHCFNTVNSNHSFSSNEDAAFFFQKQFPDSEIANGFTCGETKSMYLCCFGIAPYLQTLLENKVKNGPFVMLFDESLNRQLAKKQLDFHVRFWDHNLVESKYYTSAFIGHATALDLVNCFETHLERKIGYANLIQVSMDGPNVNWATFDKLENKLQTENNKKLLNIGSCGLHTLHNAFKAGVSDTEWDIGHKLSALYTLFDEVPARRDDYEKVTKQALYPLQFCAHRWVENVSVCERAIDLLPHLKVFVDNVNQKSIKKTLVPSHMTLSRNSVRINLVRPDWLLLYQ